ncbi:MAG: UvrD-helicase domain-containing protein [Treponema sp.]|nr:UvrD-helicase domain-containing protein [Treponema sp.]
MRIIADLHIHSRYSRATSAKLTPPHLDRWARIKGIDLVGTGDCTHPRWLGELREQLENAEEGLYVLKDGVRRDFASGPALEEELPQPSDAALPGGAVRAPRFVLTGEISSIYKRNGKTRKVHHLVMLPDFRAAAAFQARLERLGNIVSDGRPILGLDSRDILAMLLETDERSVLVPAHIWTPWFSALGAKSGFDSIEECYGELTTYIPAIETGLSSNPPMNWALSALDRFSIISNSDAHSPDKLGREATILSAELSYPALRAALGAGVANNGSAVRAEGSAAGVSPGILGTVEFFPQEGKYHYDGHRNCGVCLGPEETAALAAAVCPVCGRPLTRGVMGRVLELADRPVDERQAAPSEPGGGNRLPYYSLVPLREILGEILETGPGSKKVDAAYNGLIEKTGSEFSILMETDLSGLEKSKVPGLSGELLAGAIDRMRRGDVSISPGYDGEYGVIRVLAHNARRSRGGELFDCPERKDAPSPKARGGRAGGSARPAKAAETAGSGEAAASVKPGFSFDRFQEEIITHEGDRTIIIAGPGAGKTAVLAARVGRLIEGGADPASVLVLSFTVKAAAELRERIEKFLRGNGAAPRIGRVNTGTFHSFCCAVLREKALAAGIPPDFGILSESVRDKLLRELCTFSGGKSAPRSRRLGDYIELRKRFLLLPGDLKPRTAGAAAVLDSLADELPIPQADPEPEKLYGLYRDRLRESGVLDYDDLIAGTVRLFSAQESILSEYQKRCRYIFVDEYQDINLSQYILLRLLADGGCRTENAAGRESAAKNAGAVQRPRLWVIGDPNQAIYGFRGSDKRFIDRFTIDYPEARRFELVKSFRCADPIISAAGRLTGSGLRGTESPVDLYRFEYPTEKSEAEGVARRISRLIGGASFFAKDSGDADTADSGYADCAAPGDCAVLIRAAALAAPLIKALEDHGIPCVFAGEQPWWEEEPLKSFLEYLRENYISRNGERSDALAEDASGAAEKLRRAWEDFCKSKKTAGVSRGGALGVAANREKFGGGRTSADGEEPVDRLVRLAAFRESLSSLPDILALSSPAALPESSREGVQVMTIHASKGLEFDHVFVIGLEEGILPFTLYDDPSSSAGGASPSAKKQRPGTDIEEERRLLYVAMTRARLGLCLSWAKSRVFHGRKLSGAPSRFLGELEKLIPLAEDKRRFRRNEQLRLF